MPELPEVETVVRQISPALINKKISGIKVYEGGRRMIAPFTAPELESKLIRRTIENISRTGKFMIFKLDDNSAIVAHLRMSGRMLVYPKPIDDKHIRIHLELSDTTLNFIDTRRFGTFHFTHNPSEYAGLQRLGPDALSEKFTSEYLFNKLRGRKKPAYSALLDQSIVAGLGNIYVNEVLHAAGIHPLRPASQINKDEATQIVNHTNRILNLAINFRGTTLLDNSYTDGTGEYGGFFDKLKVYGKDKLSMQIKRIKIGGRSVFYTSDQI